MKMIFNGSTKVVKRGQKSVALALSKSFVDKTGLSEGEVCDIFIDSSTFDYWIKIPNRRGKELEDILMNKAPEEKTENPIAYNDENGNKIEESNGLKKIIYPDGCIKVFDEFDNEIKSQQDEADDDIGACWVPMDQPAEYTKAWNTLSPEEQSVLADATEEEVIRYSESSPVMKKRAWKWHTKGKYEFDNEPVPDGFPKMPEWMKNV